MRSSSDASILNTCYGGRSGGRVWLIQVQSDLTVHLPQRGEWQMLSHSAIKRQHAATNRSRLLRHRQLNNAGFSSGLAYIFTVFRVYRGKFWQDRVSARHSVWMKTYNSLIKVERAIFQTNKLGNATSLYDTKLIRRWDSEREPLRRHLQPRLRSAPRMLPNSVK